MLFLFILVEDVDVACVGLTDFVGAIYISLHDIRRRVVFVGLVLLPELLIICGLLVVDDLKEGADGYPAVVGRQLVLRQKLNPARLELCSGRTIALLVHLRPGRSGCIRRTSVN